jgi:hypothetical protein
MMYAFIIVLSLMLRLFPLRTTYTFQEEIGHLPFWMLVLVIVVLMLVWMW